MSTSSYIEGIDLSGVDSNDHRSRKGEIISLNVVFMTLIVLVTGTRMFIRLFMIHAAGIDDWLMLLAAVSTILLCTFCLVGANFGLGTHTWLLSPSLPVFVHLTTRITQSLFGCYLAYATAITLVKTSIIGSYLRIFPNRTLRRLVIAIGIFVLLTWICSTFVIVFECVPVSAAWDWTENGRCINYLAFFYVASSINIVTDIILWFAPLPIFWRMHMRKGDKIMVCGLFGVGFFAVMASIFRLTQLHGLQSNDITFTAVPSVSWSVAEVSAAILCACVPSMRPLASRILPKAFLSPSPAHLTSLAPSTPEHRSGLSPATAFELARSPNRNRYATEGVEEAGECARRGESGGGNGAWMEESIELIHMLRQGRTDWESRPATPSEGQDVATEEKV